MKPPTLNFQLMASLSTWTHRSDARRTVVEKKGFFVPEFDTENGRIHDFESCKTSLKPFMSLNFHHLISFCKSNPHEISSPHLIFTQPLGPRHRIYSFEHRCRRHGMHHDFPQGDMKFQLLDSLNFLFFPKQCGHTEGVPTVRVKRGPCRSRWGRGFVAFFL